MGVESNIVAHQISPQVISYMIFMEENLKDDMIPIIQWKKQAYVSSELAGLACNI